MERQVRSLKTLRKLRTVADWAASVRGRRKALVWLSEGIDYNVTTLFSADRVDAVVLGASSVLLQMHDTAGVISRADLSIYAIDTAGLTVESTVKDLGRWLSQTNLQAMAESTGGFALTNSNNYAAAFDRIARESSAYYVLTYSPAESSQRDGKYHRIRVRVKRPGVTARTREGYLAPRDTPEPEVVPVPVDGLSAELKSVLQSPIPVSGLPLRVSVAPFKGEGARASVLLAGEIPARALASTGDARVEVSYAAIDDAPAVRASRTLSTLLTVDSPVRVRADQGGLGFQQRLNLAPGRYQMRVGARDALRGIVGSVLLDFEVPNFSTEQLAMSGLVLGVPGRSAQALLSSDEALAAELGMQVLVDRRFTRADREIVAHVEVYDSEPSSHELDITTTLTTEDGRTVFEESETLRSEDAASSGGTHRYSVQVPLDDVSPGEYLLTVAAASRVAAPRTAERRVPLTVIAGAAPR